MSNSLWPHQLQHARLLFPSLSPWVCPLSWWCHPTISFSVTSFFCTQSFPASESFPMSCLFTSVGQNAGASASASVLPMNMQSWFPLSLSWFPLCSRDSQESFPAPQFKNINSSALNLLYGPTLTSTHDHWKNHSFDYTDFCLQSNVSAFEYAV